MSAPDDARLQRLYDSDDYHLVFQGDTAVVPWPRAPRDGTGSTSAVQALLAGPPHLFDIDPRMLLATQPKVIRHHYFHYALRSGIPYRLFADTSADPHSELNRFPVVQPDGEGFRILSGHHRALVALLTGTDLRCRIVDRTPTADAVAITPLLLVGERADVPAVTWSDIDWVEDLTDREHVAARLMKQNGKTIVVPTPEIAQRVLSLIHCDPDWAVTLVRRSFPALELGPIPRAPDLGWNTPSKYQMMASPNFCHRCGDLSSWLTDDGWACKKHAPTRTGA